MINSKNCVILVMSIFVFALFSTNVVSYIGPNYATSTESKPIGLYYDGYVQVEVGYPYNNCFEYINGWMRYYEGSEGTHDTGKIYANVKSGFLLTKKYRYWDSLVPWAPQTIFRYGFGFIQLSSSCYI
jgi:hypothetical protein